MKTSRRPLLAPIRDVNVRLIAQDRRDKRDLQRAPVRAAILPPAPTKAAPAPTPALLAVQTLLSFAGTNETAGFNNIDGFSPYTVHELDNSNNVGLFGCTKELGAWTDVPTLFSILDTEHATTATSLGLLINALAEGDLMFLAVLSYKTGGNSTPTVTDDAGETWNFIATKQFSTDYRLDLFFAIANATAADPFVGANITVDFGADTQTGIIGIALNYNASASPSSPVVDTGTGDYDGGIEGGTNDLPIVFTTLTVWNHTWGLNGTLAGGLALALT